MKNALPLSLLVLCLSIPLAGCGDDGGTGDSSGDPDGGPGGGVDAATCPPYQHECGGDCMPTANDPDHCGDCDVTCDVAGGEVCAGSACSTECLGDGEKCEGHCIDPNTDNDHCGGCDQPACPEGTGCVEGECVDDLVPPIDLPECDGGGPPLDEDEGGEEVCEGNQAQTTFRWGLCSCTDVSASSLLHTDAYDSTSGDGYTPDGLGGSVGLDGMYDNSGDTEVSGALWASADEQFHVSAQAAVGQELHIGGYVQTSSPMTVGDEAWVNGDVKTSSTIDFAGVLHVPAGAVLDTGVSYANVVNEPVDVPPPCDCEEDQIIPVGAIVASHETDEGNDNDLIGLEADALDGPPGPVRLDLPCGRFYLTAITGSHSVVIAAHGRTAIYVAGDIAKSASLRFVVDPTGELDVYVAGDVHSSAPSKVGSPDWPALSRFYIGGDTGFQISSGSLLNGFFYAVPGEIQGSAMLEMFGGLFGGYFHNSGDTIIHYDLGVLHAGDSCETPPPEGCDSCQDCNNQACIDGTCGACQTSADCCAPLVCVDGTCVSNGGVE